MKLAIILGTRPEIIKLSPVIRYCEQKRIPFFIVHSGQHYSANMDEIFFTELGLPKPKYNLNIGAYDYRRRVGFALKELHTVLEKEWPDAILVQGDTFTVLMGALAAKKLERPVAHLEAGLRSHDLSMPEENNRIITDHIAEFLYPPTTEAAKNLQEEGLGELMTPVFGNTVVDAALQNVAISEKKSNVLERLKITKKEYFLVTCHRQENVDTKERLQGVIDGLKTLRKKYPKYTILFPMHPRTAKMLNTFAIPQPKELRIIEPVGYLDFLQLEKNAALCITDSGGVQEEATIFHVPCVTIRYNTERPETIDNGMNMLAGAEADKIVKAVDTMLKKKITWKPLYGDGNTSKYVIDHLNEGVSKRKSMKARAKWMAKAAGRIVRGKR